MGTAQSHISRVRPGRDSEGVVKHLLMPLTCCPLDVEADTAFAVDSRNVILLVHSIQQTAQGICLSAGRRIRTKGA